MSANDHMPEIGKSLRTFLIDYSDIDDVVEGRVYYFMPPLPAGKQPEIPFVQFKRAGGEYGEYRFYFSVRCSNAEQLEELRRAVIRRLKSPMELNSGENIVDAHLDGQLSDGGDSSIGWYESNFYMIIELLEAGYG